MSWSVQDKGILGWYYYVDMKDDRCIVRVDGMMERTHQSYTIGGEYRTKERPDHPVKIAEPPMKMLKQYFDSWLQEVDKPPSWDLVRFMAHHMEYKLQGLVEKHWLYRWVTGSLTEKDPEAIKYYRHPGRGRND